MPSRKKYLILPKTNKLIDELRLRQIVAAKLSQDDNGAKLSGGTKP
jgi:hypothetical protein